MADPEENKNAAAAARNLGDALKAAQMGAKPKEAAFGAEPEDAPTGARAGAGLGAKAAPAAQPAFMGEYTLGPDDTLSHVALKFYGNAGRDFWMLIYEANKEVIGPNPGIVRPGTVLKIPVLPDEMKGK